MLFIDDLLIFLNGSIRDTSTFFDILTLFSKATGMEENHSKSTITLSEFSPHEERFTQKKFLFRAITERIDSNI